MALISRRLLSHFFAKDRQYIGRFDDHLYHITKSCYSACFEICHYILILSGTGITGHVKLDHLHPVDLLLAHEIPHVFSTCSTRRRTWEIAGQHPIVAERLVPTSVPIEAPRLAPKINQLIGLREKIQENPTFHGKIDGFL